MNLLERLANPYGTGVRIAFVLFLIVSVIALSCIYRMFRSPTKKSHSRELLYYAAVLVVQCNLVLMGSYFPKEEQERPETSQHYRSMADLAMGMGFAGSIAVLVLVAAALYGLVHYRDSLWHRPFMWLVMAQAALSLYVAYAAFDHMNTYDFWRWGFTHIEVSSKTHPWTLAAALVFAVVAAVNYVLVYRAVRDTVTDEAIWRYLEQRPEDTEPKRSQPLPPPQWTWLDWFAVSMASLHGIPYVPFTEPDSPGTDAAEEQ